MKTFKGKNREEWIEHYIKEDFCKEWAEIAADFHLRECKPYEPPKGIHMVSEYGAGEYETYADSMGE